VADRRGAGLVWRGTLRVIILGGSKTSAWREQFDGLARAPRGPFFLGDADYVLRFATMALVSRRPGQYFIVAADMREFWILP